MNTEGGDECQKWDTSASSDTVDKGDGIGDMVSYYREEWKLANKFF